MPPPLKFISRLVAALTTTTASEAGPRVSPHPSRIKTPPRKQPNEMSGTLAALKSGTPSTLTRPSIAAPTTRRAVGGSALLRTQSLPSASASASRTATPSHRHTPGIHPSPPLPTTPRPVPQSNSDLQQALTQSHGDTLRSPTNAKDDDAQLQEALANSRADAFMEPTSRDDEDAQLRKALLHSRADVFMPTSPSHDPQEAQLQQALALSRADAFMPPANAAEEHAQLQAALAHSRADAFMAPASPEEEKAQLQHAITQSLAETPEHAHEPDPSQHAAHTPVDPFAASQDAQMRIQVAMKKADVLKAFGEAMKELTKS